MKKTGREGERRGKRSWQRKRNAGRQKKKRDRGRLTAYNREADGGGGGPPPPDQTRAS